MSFPDNFLWGAATSSAQVEGGWDADGRSPSIWDLAPEGKIKNGENCHSACDHYHRYKEDVAIMKELGLKSYRFSLSWSRLIPEEGKINKAGVEFYNRLIDELLSSGIEPVVTLYHWDLPQWVQEKGGWANNVIVDLFAEYTKVAVDAFSDRVRYWLTFNEPQCFLMNAHMTCIHAPFKRIVFRFSRLIRHFMLANSEAVKLIRERAVKKPLVGLSFGAGACIPEKEDDPESIEKARYRSFYKGMGVMNNRLWLDPVILGKGAQAYLVYHVSNSFARKIQVNFDFLAFNNYEASNYSPWGGDRGIDKSRLKQNCLGWVTDGRTLYWTARFLYERYRLPLLITENGLALEDTLTGDGVHDAERTAYMDEYIGNVKRALDDGIDIRGYHWWSLLDNFEWAEGYRPRFGLVYVDFDTKDRTVKDSAYHYRHIIETNGEEL